LLATGKYTLLNRRTELFSFANSFLETDFTLPAGSNYFPFEPAGDQNGAVVNAQVKDVGRQAAADMPAIGFFMYGWPNGMMPNDASVCHTRSVPWGPAYMHLPSTT
jgi:hypothetical protein